MQLNSIDELLELIILKNLDSLIHTIISFYLHQKIGRKYTQSH